MRHLVYALGIVLVIALAVLCLYAWARTPTVFKSSETCKPVACESPDTDAIRLDVESPVCQKILKSGRYDTVWVP